MPFVSVVTPFYNTAEYLAECIESVLRQDHANFEYLLADNCSTDGSLEIAERYAAQDARIRVIHGRETVTELGAAGFDAFSADFTRWVDAGTRA